MSAMVFTLTSNPTLKLNCSALTPNKLAGLSHTKIGKLKLGPHTNSPSVKDYFAISGDDTSQIVFKNSNTQLNYIGMQMKNGQISIEGDAGDFLGANMQNGSIICSGNAGDRLGDNMRRGLILVEGNAGNYTGSRMIAGTVTILGCLGTYTGYSMRRGTILLAQQPSLHATLQDCGVHTLPYLSLLFKVILPLSSKLATVANNRVQRFAGDLSQNGTGEILVFQQ
ncbi:MAG: formylmethanofuran dehydrogenase subunit C [Methylophilaceae bacterium]